MEVYILGFGLHAYDKAAIKCNEREAVTNFEPSTYAGEINPMIDEGGINYNLDLNLGMSTPSSADGRCGSNRIGWITLLWQLWVFKRRMVELCHPSTLHSGMAYLPISLYYMREEQLVKWWC